MVIVLLSLLAGLGVASANAADAPVLTGGGGRQTPRVANGTSGTLPSNATHTPLPTPSPLTTTSPLNPETTGPSAPSSPTDTAGSTKPASTKPSDKTNDQATHTVRFDPNNGSKPTQSTVKTGSLAAPPEQNPQRDGFRFNGWTCNGQPYDFQTPILQDITLTAKWAKTTDWTLSPNHGPSTGAQLTINPPDKQEPYYTSIQATRDQIVGLTGDGRIYTWAQDSAPKQVPFPTQAPDGFHYLQVATSSQSQAALGSDQHIYTWTNQQATPTILDTSRNTQFTSISLNDDRLLAVDQQGQVHTFQASQPRTQDLNPKFAEQVTTSLPGRAQAVTTVASVSRILIVDENGQAWTWDADNTGKAKPVRVRQNPGIRIIQAQALNQGFLLLDADGQARYLADSATSTTAISLPNNQNASRITANKDQAVITDTDGHVWSWEPDNRPVRAGNWNQPYTQATETGNRITAIDKQGSIFTWSLNAQGNPSKPARLNTTSTPILESASMDGQTLKISKKDDSWQTEAPAHKPGQATITIIGKQDGQPLTRSLSYTVDQKLTRDTQTGTTYTVSFDTAGGDQAPDLQQVPYPYGRVQRPSPDPTRKDYRFDGWFIDGVAYDFSKPVTENLTLTAKWTRQDPNNTWRINPDKGSQLGKETTTITPPSSASGTKFNQVSGSGTNYFSLAVGSDGNAYAWGYNSDGELGDGTAVKRTTPVMVKKPDSKTYPDVPADFTYVQVSAGTDHSLALGSDGYVYAWGDDTDGELGNNTTRDSSVPVRVRDPASPNDTSKGLKAIQVSAGRDHSLAVDKDGNTWAWGSNGYGRLGNNSSNSYSTLPVRVHDPGDPSNSNKGLNVMQVSAGDWHSLAVDKDGNTWAWGRNDYGQLGNGQISSSWDAYPVPQKVLLDPNDASTGLKTLQVSAGGSLSLAIDQDGSTWAWGHNNSGQLGNGTSNGRNQNPIPSPVLLNPKNASTRLKAVQVSAGWGHSLAIGEDGNTWAWGDNSSGQLGNNGSSYQYYSPVKVLATKQSTNSAGPWLDATQISAGSSHSLAICKDGSARAWGNNSYTQLGNTDAGSRSLAPVPVMFNLQPAITGVKFDQTTVSILTHNKDDNSVSVTTPAHEPGQILVSVSYTLGGIVQKPVSLTYTYIPLGVLPQAGGEGVLLALATGTMSIGGMLASRRHRTERLQLLQALHE